MSDQDMIALAERIGDCEITTTAKNWFALHAAHEIAVARMTDPELLHVGHTLHKMLDNCLFAQVPSITEREPDDLLYTVTIPGEVLIPVTASLAALASGIKAGKVIIAGEDYLNAATVLTAVASFRTWLEDSDPEAETLLAEFWL